MDMYAHTGRRFWHSMVTTGGFTSIPRWTCRSSPPGSDVHREPLPDTLVAAVRRLAYRLGVPMGAMVLAAHAKVLAALSGEAEVITGHATASGGVLPCRLSAAAPTWRGLLLAAHRVQAQVLAFQDFPVDELSRELGVSGPLFETVCDPGGVGGEPDGATVLRVGLRPHDGRLALEVRYRTEVLDEEAAARIAGYHLTALTLITADVDAEHARQSLLAPDEACLQLDAMAGPRRRLPDRRFHELFEERAARHPHEVAAVHAGQRWTYGELNARANRLAHTLLAGGLQAEDVVAVVTERNLDWLAAVLAVFKAGGAYLPVEPHLPPGRIASVLTRAACTTVLTEHGSTASLERALPALPGTTAHFVADAADEDLPQSDPGIPVAGDQLAYLYFTSGSTGEPKGAMCEHAGFLNHLYAKIDDLGIGEGHVVAQTAPQSFDISLWQLTAPLLAGGRVLIIGQETVLDADRLLDEIAGERVGVLQVVPSHLDVVLSALEHRPRRLPDLRCVSVTGEAVKKDLVERWFAAAPGTRLVNAYGLTETSDDTNHAVMERVPDTDWVPVGRPVNNVRVYVVDEHLAPVPLGAPGLIAFSGICVGRGYVNDPARTREAYLPDPHHPGAWLYRSGDVGRWHPGGQLEFLGRVDQQVKIRGFRIEIGEIENTLARAEGVRDAAVVVTDRGTRLAAFCTGDRPLPGAVLHDHLAASLPAYMLPSAFHWLDHLPLTGNGKTDREALSALARRSGPAGGHQPPETAAEHRLAAAWAQVLGVAEHRIGRGDHFFDRGGTSLAAVRLAILLDRAVTPADVNAHPVLADLAAVLEARPGRCEEGEGPLRPSGAGTAGQRPARREAAPAPARAAGRPGTADAPAR
ncbi:amino acid adenylation domain-containing protein [Streptomyces sp. NPDC026673]|uniref:non-ribosomal peptide synthetase n=1 Tax=Streptomyces sp. NPDC026673 TaxID=3155724 RepID=UPI0034053FC0